MIEKKTKTPKDTLDNQNRIRRIAVFGSRFIDYKMGFMGAGVMGCIVFGINYYDSFELYGASTAALKQLVYTFLFGGIIMRGCEYLAIRIKKQIFALAAAIILPSAVAVTLTYGVHSMKGTPNRLNQRYPLQFWLFLRPLFGDIENGNKLTYRLLRHLHDPFDQIGQLEIFCITVLANINNFIQLYIFQP